MTMKLSIIPFVLQSLTIVTSSPTTLHPKHIEEEPFLTLDSGARVYKGNAYTPSNNRPPAAGGIISVKLPDADIPSSSFGAGQSIEVEGDSTVLFQPIGNANGAFIQAGGGPPQDVHQGNGSSGNNDEPPQGQGTAVEVDISLLKSLKSDELEVDLGEERVIFQRVEHERLHNRHTETTSPGGAERHLSKRPRYRRIQDLAGDSLCNMVDNPAQLLNDTNVDCDELLIQNEYGEDYLPSNSFYPPGDDTQKYEYFEGSSVTLGPDGQPGEVIGIYLKKLKHPVTGGYYLSGVIHTPVKEYLFTGDMVTGQSFVTVGYMNLYPSMPPPIQPGDDVVDGEEQGEEYDSKDGSGLPLAPGFGTDGRRRRLKKRNLRERSKKESTATEDEARNNPFDEQVKRQVDAYLKKEQRRLNKRRMQSDDGSVIDILIVYTKQAMCQQNSIAIGSACDAYDDIDPSHHVNIINLADNAVQYTNKAYTNSHIEFQLRLVHVHYTPDIDDSAYDCGGILGLFRRNGDGVMDEVHVVRDAWGADMVALLTSSRVSGCGGIAYVGHGSDRYSYASVMFSVTLAPYAVGGTFAHEVGHNFGCQHDRLNAPTSAPYEYGWQDPDRAFRTIMAYNCPGGYCRRIQYFSNTIERENGKIMGNELNNCARKHNEVREKVALYRNVRLTFAPTVSPAPSTSLQPSEGPTKSPTLSPTTSRVPSLTPSVSIAPSGQPSLWPTFSNAALEDYLQLDTPSTTTFNVRHGIMFDITAKDYDITIHNFRLPFLYGGEMIISIWTQENGGFWYEKNNEDAWTWQGSPDAYSPGISLEKPVPLALRGSQGGEYYGFEPILIPAGSTKGIYITINETSTHDNLLGLEPRISSQCSTDWTPPYQFPIWVENDDLALTEGVYKDLDWLSSYGSSNEAFRFLGSVYYESTRPDLPVAATPTPSKSPAPSVSLVPSHSALNELTTSFNPNLGGYDGLMFEVYAKTENIIMRNIELVIYSLSIEYSFRPVTLAVYSSEGGLYDESAGDAIAQSGWTQQGTAQVYASASFEPEPLPEGSFTPIFVKKGSRVGIFVTLQDPLRNHKILAKLGSTPLLRDDQQDTNILITEGLAKQWEPCISWGYTLVNENGTPNPHALYGSVLYTLGGTSAPTASAMPSGEPTATLQPSIASSLVPSRSLVPTNQPTDVQPPVEGIVELRTPTNITQGNSGDGVMFDIQAGTASEVYSVTLGYMREFPMDIHVYSRRGSHYAAYDDRSQWELINVYTNYTYDSVNDVNPRRISFPPQFIGAGQTRSFYIAIVETYGEIRPLGNGLLAGYDYLNGVWAGDDVLSVMEGIKFYGITADHPFGDGTYGNGVFMHQGPGGQSFNLKDAVIRYRTVDTIAPSVSPSISLQPSMSQSPSESPTASEPPSSAPTITLAPSQEPSTQPSTSGAPSSIPSTNPSHKPSTSVQPSLVPTLTAQPSKHPSESPSYTPTETPSVAPSISFQPSDTPSLLPTDAPSRSMQPSFSPSISLAPSMDRESLVSRSTGTISGAFGIMFEVVPKRAINVETFWVDTYGQTKTFTVHVYTRLGEWSGAPSDESAWTKLGQQTFTSTNQNPVKVSSQVLSPVTIYSGQTRSFYIAMEGHFFKVKGESIGTASENNDVSLYTGLRKYPYDTPFSSSGAPGCRFQGEMVYSFAIDPPSTAPSDAPSNPTVSPTVSSMPTSIPTKLPTIQPVSPQPSVSLAPTPSQPRIQIIVPSMITLSGFGIPQTTAEVATVINIVGPSLADLIRSNLRTGQRLSSVSILSINGVAVPPGTTSFTRRRLTARRLDGHIDIEYEIILEEICATQTCDDAQEVANALYNSVTESMMEEIDSGAFATALVAAAQEQNESLVIAVAGANFEEVVVTILGLLSIWYPTWISGQYCKNDGNEPYYMVYNPSAWLYDSRDGCCSRYYSYDYANCMALGSAGAIGWYPKWESSDESKCVNDDEVPNYMRNNPSQWIYENLEDCCERYYGWDKQACLVDSGGNATTVYTNKWYVNHETEVCEQDCVEDSSTPCGGAADSWKDLFDSATDCCESRLSWTSKHVCDAKSRLVAPTGTTQWYVDYQLEKCVQDCDSPTNASCGGILTSGHTELYDSASLCCSSKLGWIPSTQCQAESSNNAVVNVGSNNWYADHKLQKCVQDCADTSNPSCGGLAKGWDERFTSSGSCCSTKLWWLERSNCIKS